MKTIRDVRDAMRGATNTNEVVIKSQHYYYKINNIYEAELNGKNVIVIEEGSQVREE